MSPWAGGGGTRAAALGLWAARAWAHLAPRLAGAALRPVPMWLRRRAQRRWPPAVDGHVSGALRRLLRGGVTRAALEAAGFDPCGLSAAPLADLQAWQVEGLTGARVRDLSLYRSALTHPTALPAEVRGAHAYDRLEFLGDSVLEVVTRQVLMERYPEADEVGGVGQLRGGRTCVGGAGCGSKACVCAGDWVGPRSCRLCTSGRCWVLPWPLVAL